MNEKTGNILLELKEIKQMEEPQDRTEGINLTSLGGVFTIVCCQ